MSYGRIKTKIKIQNISRLDLTVCGRTQLKQQSKSWRLPQSIFLRYDKSMNTIWMGGVFSELENFSPRF